MKMYNTEFLIKPASASCNIDCEYCFYKDISNRRKILNYGNMSIGTLEKIVIRAYQETKNSVIFAFQGGEPLLVGIDFYYKFFEFIRKYNINKIKTNITIQTNGILIDDKWAKLFKDKDVLIGISLDGPKDIHDVYRLDYHKKPTHKKVMQAIQILRKYKVKFNILTVISKYV